MVPFHADSVFCMIHQSLINRQFIFHSLTRTVSPYSIHDSSTYCLHPLYNMNIHIIHKIAEVNISRSYMLRKLKLGLEFPTCGSGSMKVCIRNGIASSPNNFFAPRYPFRYAGSWTGAPEKNANNRCQYQLPNLPMLDPGPEYPRRARKY